VLHGHPNRDFSPEFAWIKANAHEYTGYWLAVLGDKLLAADPDLGAVIVKVRALAPEQAPLLHLQPAPLPTK
jgi:hypothetical protein